MESSTPGDRFAKTGARKPKFPVTAIRYVPEKAVKKPTNPSRHPMPGWAGRYAHRSTLRWFDITQYPAASQGHLGPGEPASVESHVANRRRARRQFYFDSQPNMLDQFLINKDMATCNAPIEVDPATAQILKPPAMVTPGVYPKPIPFGGMGRPINENGFSDHFPVTEVDQVTCRIPVISRVGLLSLILRPRQGLPVIETTRPRLDELHQRALHLR
jgi:hypothetical protein